MLPVTSGKPNLREERIMPTGTVKYIDNNGQYLFISHNEKKTNLFLKINEALNASHTEIRKYQRWSFDLAEGRDGRPRADKLVPLDG